MDTLTRDNYLDSGQPVVVGVVQNHWSGDLAQVVVRRCEASVLEYVADQPVVVLPEFACTYT
jgi:hypothetical protein